MEPIVNPWLIYLASIVENLRTFFGTISFIVLVLDVIIIMGIFIEGDALIGYIKDLDDFDYGTIIIKEVVS